MNRKTLFGLVIVIAFVAVLIVKGDVSALSQVRSVGSGFILSVISVTMLLVLASSLRWRLVFSKLFRIANLPFFEFYRVTLAGVTLGQVVPQDVGSAGARIAYLRAANKLPVQDAAFSVLLDRWFDVVALLVAVPVSVLFVAGLINLWTAATLMIAALLIVGLVGAARPRLITMSFTVAFSLATVLLRRIRPGSHAGRRSLTMDQGDLAGASFIAVFVLSISRLMIVGLRAWIVIVAVGIDLPLLHVLLIVPIAQVALMAPITPGGLGIYDAGWYGLLALVGVPPGAAVLFVVLHRVLTLLSLLVLISLTELPLRVNRMVRSRHA